MCLRVVFDKIRLLFVCRGLTSDDVAELRAMGVNDSMVHEDFMIGSADLAVTGVTASGERIPIFTGGGWAL